MKDFEKDKVYFGYSTKYNSKVVIFYDYDYACFKIKFNYSAPAATFGLSLVDLKFSELYSYPANEVTNDVIKHFFKELNPFCENDKFTNEFTEYDYVTSESHLDTNGLLKPRYLIPEIYKIQKEFEKDKVYFGVTKISNSKVVIFYDHQFKNFCRKNKYSVTGNTVSNKWSDEEFIELYSLQAHLATDIRIQMFFELKNYTFKYWGFFNELESLKEFKESKQQSFFNYKPNDNQMTNEEIVSNMPPEKKVKFAQFDEDQKKAYNQGFIDINGDPTSHGLLIMQHAIFKERGAKDIKAITDKL